MIMVLFVPCSGDDLNIGVSGRALKEKASLSIFFLIYLCEPRKFAA